MSARNVGQLVACDANDWGPAKIVGIEESGATLEYFDSIGQVDPARVVAPLNSLRPFRAKPQTRCYWQAGGQWQVGRIIGHRDDRYVVRSSRATDQEISESDVYVRWHRRLVDPTDVLVVRGNESAYFHNCRQPFVASLARQRAACRGLPALLSSVVQFYEHQVEVARRVLTDPVQRYLLADEVGLGKTIEAGFVMRQYLLDEPTAFVMVLAPEPLRVQWVTELQEKFLLDDFTLARVKVLGHGDWRNWGKHGSPGMVIVDEAHHLTDSASSNRDSADRYAELEQLAIGATRLLLLSATPLLHNEGSFLGMLHLLDPELHDLRQVAEFKLLVERRQELGRLFYTLRPDTPPFLLEEKTTRLREMFPRDDRLAELLDGIDSAVMDDSQTSSVADAVVAARVHISEAYRLHRRLLRTRRTEAVLDTYPVRGRRLPTSVVDVDARRQTVDLWLDSWRDQLLFETSSRQGAPLEVSDAMRVFWLFLERSGSDLSVLGDLARACLGDDGGANTWLDLAPTEMALIGRFPFSTEARGLLGGLLRELDQPGAEDRISLAARHLLMRPKQTKTVVFSRFHRVAERLAAVMTSEAGPSAVAVQLSTMDPTHLDEELKRFERNTFCRYLICDSSAEEGRNLQFADCLVHVDLHLNPNRLEQRIGRMDRYSSGRAVESVVFQDDPRLQPGYQPAWLTCLVEGFRVFDESIAGVQYAVERVMTDVRRGVFIDGVGALVAAQDAATSALTAERLAIAEQDALDGIEALETDVSLFNTLDQLENDWRNLRKAVGDWASDAKGNLRFDRIEDSSDRDVFQFAVNPDRREATINSMPLVAWDVLAESFGGVARRKGSFRREAALRTPGARVFRIGEPFIDALASFTRWDDRGRAFATWRHRGEWRGNPDFVAIRFDYIVEGDATPALETIGTYGNHLERSVAQRRMDACFPPMVATIWLDVGLEEIDNPTVLKIISEAYDPAAGDVNLSVARQWALDEVIGRDLWEPLLREARRQSNQLLEVRPDLVESIQAAQERAKQQADITLQQLQVRLQAGQIGGADLVANAHDLSLERAIADAVVAGVASPIISLDSVGVVILSGRLPDGLQFGVEEADDGG